jgi:hypothetical protein
MKPELTLLAKINQSAGIITLIILAGFYLLYLRKKDNSCQHLTAGQYLLCKISPFLLLMVSFGMLFSVFSETNQMNEPVGLLAGAYSVIFYSILWIDSVRKDHSPEQSEKTRNGMVVHWCINSIILVLAPISIII